MFSDKEISAYNSIKAPDELYKKISRTKKTYKLPLYIATAVAASFVFIISGYFLTPKSSIIVNGQKLTDSVVFYDTTSASARNVSSTILVPIEIKVNGNTTVSVSQGNIISVNNEPKSEIELSDSGIVWWEISPEQADGIFKMQITDKKGVKTISLKYQNTKITVTKEK